MQTSVTLMVLPPSGKDDPPRFFLEEKGRRLDGTRNGSVWRDLSWSGPLPDSLENIQANIEKRFNELMNEVEKRNAYPGWGYGADLWYEELYYPLMPQEVKDVLKQVAEQASMANEVPILRIHVSPLLDWIPWEIMYDETDFLGLRFQITRLPIMSTVPDLGNNNQPHQVRSIHNLLGNLGHGVLNDQLWETWDATFSDLIAQPGAVQVTSRPENRATNQWPRLQDVQEAEQGDILHFTCHGGIEDQVTRASYWTLDLEKSVFLSSRIRLSFVKLLNLRATKPLVFGNACYSSAGGRSLMAGFGPNFFARGAMAFIGTFAPIRTQLAFGFARQFYKRLLRDGLPIGKALWATKEHYYREQEVDPSFLFYCLYGPPDTRFVLTE